MPVLKKIKEFQFGNTLTAPSLPRFWYTWLVHPFDDPQHFHVDAADRQEADRLATERFRAMFDRGETVMKEFWPMRQPPPLHTSFRPHR